MKGNVYNQEKVYIVDFQEAASAFRQVIGIEELPTIDADMVYWRVLEIFEKIRPLQALHELAKSMVEADYLFAKEEYFETTQWQRDDADRFLRQYLYDAIIQLGESMYRKLQEVGMIVTGTERYKNTARPLTDDTYLFKRTRA